MDVKKTIADFAEIIEPRLEKYWQQEISRNFGFNQHQKDLVKKVLEHAKEHNLRPGKRLRASLVYYGYLLGRPEDEKIFKAAMAVELVHSALLIHDDFMDQDEIRRGLPTTHKLFAQGDDHYGASMALNLGDIVLTLGYDLLLDSDFEPALINKATAKLLKTIINTGYGQILDISLEKLSDLNESDAIAVHKTKTALYTYENPLSIGAILAELDQKILDILHDYAMNAGVAFQLQDDILGIIGDSQKTGKSDNSDLLQGKGTLLAIYTLKKGSEAQKQAFKRVWGKRTASDADISAAKQAIMDSGSFAYSKKMSKDYAARAIETITRLNEFDLNPASIEYLKGIAEYMVNRDV